MRGLWRILTIVRGNPFHCGPTKNILRARLQAIRGPAAVTLTFGSPLLYALRTTRYHPGESKWRDFNTYSHRDIAPELRNWLLDQGSLTQRLIQASEGNFAVRLLAQRWQRPRLSEALLLGLDPRTQTVVREVALTCWGEPWVYARSVLPFSSLQGKLRRLRKLDESALGALLFKEPSLKRSAFQLACIEGQDTQIPEHLRQSENIWGRRSRFEVGGNPLMVSEIFLSSAFKRPSSDS